MRFIKDIEVYAKSNMTAKYFIGIDGGGTKTEFILADESGRLRGNVVKSGSNPNDIGIEDSAQVLREGIAELVKDYDKNNLYIFAGVSGAGVGENSTLLRQKLLLEYPHVEVASDLMNAIEVCLQGSDGIAVICGTGISSVICKGGKHKIVGGYGYLFEDGGSGYAYGRDAIKAAIRYEDGCGEKTLLYDYLSEILGRGIRASLGEILRKGKFFVASFCPLVFKGYQAGDSICKNIIEINLLHTVSLIKDTLSLYNQRPSKIAFMGGVSKETLFRERLTKEFAEYVLSFCEEKPVMGAVRRAMKGERKC